MALIAFMNEAKQFIQDKKQKEKEKNKTKKKDSS